MKFIAVLKKSYKTFIYAMLSGLVAMIIYSLLHGRYTGIYLPWLGSFIVLPLRHWIVFVTATLLSVGTLWLFIYKKNTIMRTMALTCEYAKLCKLFICLYAGAVFIIVASEPLVPVGEAGLYALGAAALQYCRSIFITYETQVAITNYFPAFSWHTEQVLLNNHFPLNSITGETVNVSFYFPAYSASIIPMSLILKLLGLNQSYAFVLTNAILAVLALVFVYKYLKIDEKNKFLLILALGINPIIYYISWASAEVFVYFFIVLSMLFYFNKAYKRAAFFLTIAGSMNLTAMALGFAMIISYFIDLQKEKGNGNSFFRTIIANFKDVLRYAASFSFIFLVFIYNYIATAGQNTLTTQSGLIDTDAWFIDPLLNASVFQRTLAYLFDLNFGLLPWFGILFAIYLIGLLISIITMNYRFLIPALGHLLIMIGFSLHPHINSGMSGINRYNVWSAPIMIFICILLFPEGLSIHKRAFTNIVNKISAGITRVKQPLIILSSALTGTLILLVGIPITQNAWAGDTVLPPARFVLNRAPSLYNPLYSTFINRVSGIHGGYQYANPVLYIDSRNNLYIRKILVRYDDTEELLHMVAFGNNESRLFFENRIEQLSGNDGFSYINIPRRYRVMVAPPPIQLREPIIFYEAEEDIDVEIIGSMYPVEQDFGMWSSGYETLFSVMIDEPIHTDFSMELTFTIFGDMQIIKFYANDKFVAERTVYNTGYWQRLSIDIPGEVLTYSGVLLLRFEHPYAASLNPGLINPEDKIAIAFRELVFVVDQIGDY